MLKVSDEGEIGDKIHVDTLHTEEQIKIVDFLSEITQERRQWHNIFKVLKVKTCEPRLLYLIKLSFRKKGKINISKSKNKDFSQTYRSSISHQICITRNDEGL